MTVVVGASVIVWRAMTAAKVSIGQPKTENSRKGPPLGIAPATKG